MGSSPVSVGGDVVADGALLSLSHTGTSHITLCSERDRSSSSTLPGCCVRVDEKRRKKRRIKRVGEGRNTGFDPARKDQQHTRKKAKERDVMENCKGHESVSEFD